MPAFRTTPPPNSPSIGRDTAATARVLGHKLIPWQAELAAGAGTLTAAGGWRYRFVVVIVPRRAGKTLVMLAHAMTVGRRRPRARSFYASHRRETGAAMWRDDWFPMLETSALYPKHVKLRRSNGSEAVTWHHTRSTLRLLPPSGDAIRSFASDLAMIDEAREFSVDQGDDVEGAVLPTGATGAGGQFWIVSNAGDATAQWLRKWRDLGRSSIDDPDSPVFYVEFAAPDGADPDDPATLLAAHPAAGYHLNVDAVNADRAVMTPDTYAAEYLGWWPETLVDTALVSGWALGESTTAAPADPVALAVEIDPDRGWCSIVAASGDVVEVVEHRAHGDWVAARMVDLCAAHRPIAVAWDGLGPAASLDREFHDLPARPVPLGTREVAAAAGSFYDGAVLGAIGHRADDDLDAAIVSARRRTAGGSWVFDRRQPGAGPLIAATLARWVARDARRAPPGVA